MNWRRASLAAALLAVSVLAVPAVSRAALPAGRSGPQGKARIATIDNERRIDVNQINMWVTNYGSFAWDLTTGNAGLIFPKGTAKTAVFASGVWLGAVVGGEVRTVVAEYSQEYGPGSMVGGTFDDPSNHDYIEYKVARFSGDPQDTAHVERTAEELSADPNADPLVHHSWNEYMTGAAPHGAPTRLYQFPDPANPGNTVDIPGPDILGDQMLWAVYNDADPDNHTNDAGGSTPLGVEIQQTTFGFNRTGALGNTVFLKFKIINNGDNQLDSMFVSLWSDPDLGGFTDDLVGVDTALSLGYVYNSTNADQLYGTAPPAVGYDFFLGPINSLGDTLGLASFNKYINGTDPSSTSETYNYMNGLLPDGSILIDPTTGEPTRFFHPGDPVLHKGWLDSNPADRRFLLTSGPFSMAPGDTQIVVGAIIVGQGGNRISSIRALRFFDQSAQLAFDLDFNLPSPPPQPKVDVTVDHGRVNLCWDAVAANNPNFPEPDYTFQGYNVYQGESVAGPWHLVATYDVVDAITTVYEPVFDPETGDVVPQAPVTFGSNSGLTFCHTETVDEIRGGSLKDGTEYFYAVTAFSIDTTKVFPFPKVLENAQVTIRAIPQRTASGTDFATTTPSDVQQFQIDTAPHPTTDHPVVDVVTPSDVLNADYKITFSPLVPPFEGQVGEDTATVVNGWNLIRTSLNGQATNDTLLKNQINRRGDFDYEVVDGIRVRFVWPTGYERGSYFPLLLEANPDPFGGRSINPAFNWSGNPDYFLGGAGFGKDFFDDDGSTPWGSTLDPVSDIPSFTRVILDFGATPSQKAYRFLRYQLADTSDVNPSLLPGDPPSFGRRYQYAGFFDIPLQCQDVLENQQLDCAFVETVLLDSTETIMPASAQLASFDSTYRPRGPAGGHEYFFVINRPYDGIPDPTIATDGSIRNGTLPILYALWASRRGTRLLENSSSFDYYWVVPATSNDYFTFSTSSLVRGNAALAATLLDRIRVVPNPYFNRSRYELSQFNRIVRFINLPEQCTIRIYNLGGDLVRTLQKTDPTSSVLNWDLQTENNLPVASGVYIFHVDAPGVGRTFGRMIVFMEKERLNNF